MDRRVTSCCLFALTAATACIAPACIAPARAAPFTNKTVVLEWISVGSGTRADGTLKHFHNRNAYTMYVSGAGRVFLRRQHSILGKDIGSTTAEKTPEDYGAGGTVRFEGAKLIGTLKLQSGAGRFFVDFDPSFSSCTANVVYGRDGGAKIRARGPDGSMYEIHEMKAMSPTCSIQEGNPFQ